MAEQRFGTYETGSNGHMEREVADKSSRNGSKPYAANDRIKEHMEPEKQATAISPVESSAGRTSFTEGHSSPLKRSSWSTVFLKLPLLGRVVSSITDDRFKPVYFETQHPRQRARPWMTTFIRFGPLSGIFCMLLAIASIVATLGILMGSNHAPTASWDAPPSTYLAICTAIANLAMRYACIQGVIIAWWYRACKGSNIEKLHHDWRAGTTLRGALTSGRHLGILGLACIASTFVVVDGPLLQRASTVTSAPIDRPVPLNVTVAPEIPSGFTGEWITRQRYDPGQSWTYAFNSTMPGGNDDTVSNNIYSQIEYDIETNLTQSWFFREAPLTGVFQGCKGTCQAKLIAPALAVTSCSSHQIPVDYTQPWHVPKGGRRVIPALNQQSFFVTHSLVVTGEQESINLVTGHADVDHCAGTLSYSACTLRSAIGEHNVTINDDVATLDDDTVGNPRILALSDSASVNHTSDQFGYHWSTLGGVAFLSFLKWDSYYAVYEYDGEPFSVTEKDQVSFDYRKADNAVWCHSYSDPSADMLASINKLMTYMDPKWTDSIHTNIIGREVGEQNVFHTNFYYFLAAALVELICIVLVAPTYWGWWELGRPMSFSPLELAKAFKSPLLAECNSNSSGRDLVKVVGDRGLRYGVSRVDEESGKLILAFADRSNVESPRKGERFDA